MLRAQRPTIIVGNWKMHKTIAEAKLFIEKLSTKISHTNVNVWIAVPFTAIEASVEAARNTPILIGAQNVNEEESGAFTGEISCDMLKDAGAAFVLIGHSERRKLYFESDAAINKKIKRALHDHLRPVLCVGETLIQHKKGQAFEIVAQQLSQGLKEINAKEMHNIILAYEPVWAIGSNQTVTPEQAQKMHLFCREFLSRHWTNAVAEKVVILYGGSVKPDNASALLLEPDVDGLLVGGSSLSVDSFSKIIDCYNINVSKV